MPIIDTVTMSKFRDSFYQSDQYKNNFSYEGLEALYNYLWEYSEDTGQDIEMDYVAFSCEYSEFENLKDFQDQYGEEYKSIDDIREKTTVIEVGKWSFPLNNNERFIIQQF